MVVAEAAECVAPRDGGRGVFAILQRTTALIHPGETKTSDHSDSAVTVGASGRIGTASSALPLPVRRRVLIAGSAAVDGPAGALRFAHELLAALVPILVEAGGTFVVPIDAEPIDPASGLPLLFDWTVLEHAWRARDRRPAIAGPAPFIVAVAHSKGLRQVPASRAKLWSEVRIASDVNLISLGDMNSGALRRDEQARVAEVLVTLGGGEGVRHLAELLHASSRPVVPLNLPLGRPNDGSEFLARRAARRASDFFQTSGPAPHGLLDSIDFSRDNSALEGAEAIAYLLSQLRPPRVLAVRLLNPDHPEFAVVERTFNDVLDPVVTSAGYEMYTAGRLPEPRGFLDREIVSLLEESEVVLADVTGARPNCFLELGYALGAKKPTLVTARRGTDLPFDIVTFPVWFWRVTEPKRAARVSFADFWRQQLRRSPLAEKATLE